MRFSLIDLVIQIGCLMLGFPLVITIGWMRGYEHLSQGGALLPFGYLSGAIIYLIFSPLIYRLLRLRPLLVPKCPQCGQRPGCGEVIEARWPRFVVICGNCKKKSEIWYVRPADKDISAEIPGVYLGWPQSIGRWRLIEKGKNSLRN
jgi:hypothetical protein